MYTPGTVNDEDERRTVLNYSATVSKQTTLGDLLFEYEQIKARRAEIADEDTGLEAQQTALYDELSALKTAHDFQYDL